MTNEGSVPGTERLPQGKHVDAGQEGRSEETDMDTGSACGGIVLDTGVMLLVMSGDGVGLATGMLVDGSVGHLATNVVEQGGVA